MSRTERKPYTKSKSFDASCRCHGSCPWCANSRQFKNERRKPLEIVPENVVVHSDSEGDT